jgi:hypothetical protein
VLEPSAGSGKMVAVLKDFADTVIASDIAGGQDFLTVEHFDGDAIITNPPFGLAQQFIEHALRLTKPVSGVVAMLLRTDFDHAKTRSHLFAGCSAFTKKLVLTKRIRWFEDSTGNPSFNHAWFLWNHRHQGAPTLAYAPPLIVSTKTAPGGFPAQA